MERAFGADNRRRLIEQFLEEHEPVTPQNAWSLLYKLLLWINRTIGLAHCYESDKCQPGGRWYGRSLAFHDWLATQFDVNPGDLGSHIDWLFKCAVADLTRRSTVDRVSKATRQRAPFERRGLPLPGEDAELVDIARETLSDYLRYEPPPEAWHAFTSRAYSHFYLENKRKNLLGEGFEDALAAVICRLQTTPELRVGNRLLLGDIPGFRHQGATEKPKRVDLVIADRSGDRRCLVTAKWSVRADREEQFGTDFDAYVRVNSGRPFDYVLVTNEFDAARLKAACEKLAGNAPLFTSVVHVAPAAVARVYEEATRGAATDLQRLIEAGRLVSLEQWLAALLA